MIYKENPCQYKPCADSAIINVNDILLNTSRHSYEIFDEIQSNQTYTTYGTITKFKTLKLHPNSKIAIELEKIDDYCVLVIETLILNDIDVDDYELLIEWFRGSIGNIMKNLKGKDGISAPPGPYASGDGKPGGTGEKGKTKHSPNMFLFVDKLIINNSEREFASFKFSLGGLEGGDGGDGGDGSNGAKGGRGSHGRQGGIFHACRSGSDGGQGGRPGPGGRGGDGGCGGNGPILNIYYGDEGIRPILERSKYDVSGGGIPYNPDAPYPGAGKPGKAGKPGLGGDGGRRAGSCDGGDVGRDGLPTHGTPPWDKFNLGHGLPATFGKDGSYIFDPIEDNTLRIVFNDPDNPIDNKV